MHHQESVTEWDSRTHTENFLSRAGSPHLEEKKCTRSQPTLHVHDWSYIHCDDFFFLYRWKKKCNLNPNTCSKKQQLKIFPNHKKDLGTLSWRSNALGEASHGWVPSLSSVHSTHFPINGILYFRWWTNANTALLHRSRFLSFVWFPLKKNNNNNGLTPLSQSARVHRNPHGHACSAHSLSNSVAHSLCHPCGLMQATDWFVRSPLSLIEWGGEGARVVRGEGSNKKTQLLFSPQGRSE